MALKFLFLSAIVIVSLYITIIQINPIKKQKETNLDLTLNKQEKIINKCKINIQGIKTNNKIYLTINLESTQNTPNIVINIKEQLLLLNDLNETIKIINDKCKKITPYHYKYEIITDDIDSENKLDCYLFLEQESKFTWQLNKDQ